MRGNRMIMILGILVGVVVMVGLGGYFFVRLPVRVTSTGAAGAVSAVGGGLGSLPWIMISVLALIVVVGVLVFSQSRRSSGVQRKRKHDDAIAPYLDQMIEQGVVRLEDDGELPELSEDDLYADEKPKRSEDEDFR